MKHTLLILTAFLITNSLYSQKTGLLGEKFVLKATLTKRNAKTKKCPFKRKTIIDSVYYSNKKNVDKKHRLKIEEKKSVWKVKSITVKKNSTDTTKVMEKVRDTLIDFEGKKIGITALSLEGDIVQDGNILKFYPFIFRTQENSQFPYNMRIFNSDTNSAKSKAINDNIERLKKDYFILEIPNRTVLKVKYRAWQYGALTMPLKVYSNTFDSLSNIETNVNVNLMFGRKWGKMRYRYYAGSEKAPYVIGKSLNLIAGIGKSTMTSKNTNGQDFSKDIDIAVLSYGAAFGMHFNKVGLFVIGGWDTPLSKYGKDWKYRENFWLAFGLGLGL